jgi:hypothetical protein
MSTDPERPEPKLHDPHPVGPEVVLDVERRSGAFVLVLANTGTSTAFEPRVRFASKLIGLQGELVVSDLPIWTGLAMLRPGSQVDVLLDAQTARRAPEDRRFTVTVAYRDGGGRGVERVFTHDLDAYVGLPSLVADVRTRS